MKLAANRSSSDRRVYLAQQVEAEHSIGKGMKESGLLSSRTNFMIAGVCDFPEETLDIRGGAFQRAQEDL